MAEPAAGRRLATDGQAFSPYGGWDTDLGLHSLRSFRPRLVSNGPLALTTQDLIPCLTRTELRSPPGPDLA